MVVGACSLDDLQFLSRNEKTVTFPGRRQQSLSPNPQLNANRRFYQRPDDLNFFTLIITHLYPSASLIFSGRRLMSTYATTFCILVWNNQKFIF
jgi:hypothetical protein